MEAPLTARRVAGLLATPGCERRSRLVVAGVDLDALAVRLGGETVGQSPFALARSAQFEARLKADGYADLRALISEHLGVPVEQVRTSDLAACLADERPNLHLLGLQTLAWAQPARRSVSEPGLSCALDSTADGVLEVDSLMIVSGQRLHLIGVRTYAMIGEVADPAKVAATSRELAVELVALRNSLAEPDRLSTRTLLVLPRNFGLQPTAALLDVAPQVARVRALAAGLQWRGEQADAELLGAAGVRTPGSSVQLAMQLPPKFGDGCPQCPLMGHCADELSKRRSVVRLGSAVANVVDGHSTVDEALLDPPPDQQVRMRMRAMQQGRAVRRASRRHAHLAGAPLVVVGYHLAGEPAAVLALHYGTSPGAGKLLVAAEPRDREQRLALLREFAADLSAHVAGFDAVEPVVRRDMTVVECSVDAPQLITPNAATAQWVTDLLGRYLRGTDDEVCAAAGRHLNWFAARRVLPGSAALLTATGLLTAHWVTGQLPAEDVHLPSLLGWIDPGSPVDDLPMGPICDPHWDSARLAPALGDPAQVRAAVAGVLGAAWEQTWRALDLVRSELPEVGAHVGERWERDRWSFTAHWERMAEGTAGVRLTELPAASSCTPRLFTGVPAYRFLHELETRTVALERQMALDDPLVMAAYQVSGDALSGVVSKVDREHTLASPTGRELLRPRVWLSTEAEYARPIGTQLWLASDPKIMVTVNAVEPGNVELIVRKGAVQRAASQKLPQVGDEVVFAPFGPEDVFPSKLPDQLPWQFGEPPAPDPEPVLDAPEAADE